MSYLRPKNSEMDRSTSGLSGKFHLPTSRRRPGVILCIVAAVAGTKTEESSDMRYIVGTTTEDSNDISYMPERYGGYGKYNPIDDMGCYTKVKEWQRLYRNLYEDFAELQGQYNDLDWKYRGRNEEGEDCWMARYDDLSRLYDNLLGENKSLETRVKQAETATTSLKVRIQQLEDTLQNAEIKITEWKTQHEEDQTKITEWKTQHEEDQTKITGYMRKLNATAVRGAKDQYVGKLFGNKSSVTISMVVGTESDALKSGVTKVIGNHLSELQEAKPGKLTPHSKLLDPSEPDAQEGSGRVYFRMDNLSLRESIMIQRKIDSPDFIDKLERHLEGRGYSVRVEQAGCEIELIKVDWYKDPLIISHIAVGACILGLFFIVLCKLCGSEQERDFRFREERHSEIPDSDIEVPEEREVHAPVLRSKHDDVSFEEAPWVARNRKRFLAETVRSGISPRKAEMVFNVIGELREQARIRSLSWPKPRIHKRIGKQRSRTYSRACPGR